jgi:hypothetical protein
MKITFSDKTLNFTYKECGVSIYDIKCNDGKWFCTVTITSPMHKQHVDDTRISPSGFDCVDDNQAIEIAKQYAISWIEKASF